MLPIDPVNTPTGREPPDRGGEHMRPEAEPRSARAEPSQGRAKPVQGRGLSEAKAAWLRDRGWE